MTYSKKNGGPAFPSEVRELSSINDGGPEVFITAKKGGMSLRDYFAAKAMEGIVSTGGHDPFLYDQLAAKCYILADSMLKAREQ